MPHVNGVPDKTKWLLQTKYNFDTLYITQNVIGWEFSIDRNVILLMPKWADAGYMYAMEWNVPCTILLNHHSCFQPTVLMSVTNYI